MSEREIVREVNALTLMPLPVKLLASWYDTLPKVLPLLRRSTEQTHFAMAEDLVNHRGAGAITVFGFSTVSPYARQYIEPTWLADLAGGAALFCFGR